MVSRGFGNLLLAISIDGHWPWTCWHVYQRCWPYCGPQIASVAAAVTHPVHPEQMVCISPFPDGSSLMQSLGWLGVCGWGVGTMGGGITQTRVIGSYYSEKWEYNSYTADAILTCLICHQHNYI